MSLNPKVRQLSYGIAFLLLSCQSSVTHDFTRTIEHHLISSGSNRPDFNPYADSVDHFIFALHKGTSPKNFARQADWSEDKLNKTITLLKEKGFLWINAGGQLKPRVMVVSPEDEATLTTASKLAARQIADSIQRHLPALQKQYESLSFSNEIPFHDFSFFLLSNVLLDNFQIDRVEQGYLNSVRTERHGKNYYYQLAEADDDSVEVFGIYGNHFWCNDTLCVGVYGNRRKFLNLDQYLNQPLPLVSAVEYRILKEMAARFEPTLISILKSNDAYFRNTWKESVYADEISYEEYFIWLYHFIYTEATNELAARRLLEIPDGGNIFYKANY